MDNLLELLPQTPQQQDAFKKSSDTTSKMFQLVDDVTENFSKELYNAQTPPPKKDVKSKEEEEEAINALTMAPKQEEFAAKSESPKSIETASETHAKEALPSEIKGNAVTSTLSLDEEPQELELQKDAPSTQDNIKNKQILKLDTKPTVTLNPKLHVPSKQSPVQESVQNSQIKNDHQIIENLSDDPVPKETARNSSAIQQPNTEKAAQSIEDSPKVEPQKKPVVSQQEEKKIENLHLLEVEDVPPIISAKQSDEIAKIVHQLSVIGPPASKTENTKAANGPEISSNKSSEKPSSFTPIQNIGSKFAGSRAPYSPPLHQQANNPSLGKSLASFDEELDQEQVEHSRHKFQKVKKQFLHNIRMSLKLLKKGSAQEVQMRLQPKMLGNMLVKIQIEEQSAKASFVVENQTAKELLQRNLPQLQQSLSEQGIHADHIDVEVSSDHSDSEQGSSAARNQEEQEAMEAFLNSFRIHGQSGTEIDEDIVNEDTSEDSDSLVNVLV